MKKSIQGRVVPFLAARGGCADESAFNRLEFICVVATVALLIAVVVPGLASSKPRSEQAICVNNLRLIGQALLAFNAENNNLDPWRAPGYGYMHPARANSFLHGSFLSNYLASPKVFACPSDSRVRMATDFSLSSQGGFLNAFYRNSAISYFWGLDSSEVLPESILSGDTNIRYESLGAGCSSGITPVASIIATKISPSGWRAGLHGPAGNILLHDGRVEQTSEDGVNHLFRNYVDDNGSVHLLLPRP